jgi:hypothetical protein
MYELRVPRSRAVKRGRGLFRESIRFSDRPAWSPPPFSNERLRSSVADLCGISPHSVTFRLLSSEFPASGFWSPVGGPAVPGFRPAGNSTGVPTRHLRQHPARMLILRELAKGASVVNSPVRCRFAPLFRLTLDYYFVIILAGTYLCPLPDQSESASPTALLSPADPPH